MRGGNILVLLRLTAAEERHLLLFLQPSSLGNGGACKRGSLGIVHLSSSSCYTANGSPCKQSCFTLRDKPACLRGCDIPTRWMPAPTRSLCWSRHEVEKGCKSQRSQDSCPPWDGNTKLTFKPRGEFLQPASLAEAWGHPHCSTGCNG